MFPLSLNSRSTFLKICKTHTRWRDSLDQFENHQNVASHLESLTAPLLLGIAEQHLPLLTNFWNTVNIRWGFFLSLCSTANPVKREGFPQVSMWACPVPTPTGAGGGPCQHHLVINGLEMPTRGAEAQAAPQYTESCTPSNMDYKHAIFCQSTDPQNFWHICFHVMHWIDKLMKLIVLVNFNKPINRKLHTR